MVAASYPRLHARLDFSRPGAVDALAGLTRTTTEFDSDATGRGDSYRRAQRDALVRWTGARRLLQLATPEQSAGDVTVLDVLGGDGTITRAVADQRDSVTAKLDVLTGDISGVMVERALAQGLPAVRQSASFLFLRDESVDAALLAYGTHHIAPADRPRSVAEAVRVVRRGGRVVVHDFDETSPMARFFRQLVDPYSAAGHAYNHFSCEELADLFRPLGASVRVEDVYDPLIVRAATAAQARDRMCAYIGDMYGIRSVLCDREGTVAGWEILEHVFDHTDYLAEWPEPPGIPTGPVVHQSGGTWVAEVPRLAIVAVAQKAV